MPVVALERPDTTFKIFQFPADMIPRVDGDPVDWAMVPAEYAIGIDQLKDTVHDSPIDTTDLDVTVRVGWDKGLNRLYFLYEAYDDEAAFQEHLQSRHFKEFSDRVSGLVTDRKLTRFRVSNDPKQR